MSLHCSIVACHVIDIVVHTHFFHVMLCRVRYCYNRLSVYDVLWSHRLGILQK